MPVDETTTTNIVCDNSTCPGHPDLDPAKREGWLFISHEVYGQPTAQNVFGSYDCLSAASSEPAPSSMQGGTA
jgi:hypothetical protein